MPECANCESFVTCDFQRVFAGNDGDVHGCLDCMGNTAIKNGKATDTS